LPFGLLIPGCILLTAALANPPNRITGGDKHQREFKKSTVGSHSRGKRGRWGSVERAAFPLALHPFLVAFLKAASLSPQSGPTNLLVVLIFILLEVFCRCCVFCCCCCFVLFFLGEYESPVVQSVLHSRRSGRRPILGDIQGQAGQCSKQPFRAVGVPVHCRGVGLDGP